MSDEPKSSNESNKPNADYESANKAAEKSGYGRTNGNGDPSGIRKEAEAQRQAGESAAYGRAYKGIDQNPSGDVPGSGGSRSQGEKNPTGVDATRGNPNGKVPGSGG